MAGLQRSPRVAARPPLPPEPYELRTTFPSDPVVLRREYLLLPYYALFFSTIFLLSPVWVPLGVIIECPVKVGLWPYIERLLRYLVLSPTLSAAQITSRLLGYCYSAAIRLSRGCIRIALETPRYIVKSTSLATALVLLPFRALLGSVHRTTKLASVLFSPISCPVECDKASCTCSLAHSRDAMAGFGKKLFYGIVTLLIGIFAVFPLIAFAAVTFSIAIVWLSGTILFKGGGVIRRGITHWWQGDDRNSPAAIAERNRTAAIAKREARSRSESFSQSSTSSFTPRSQSNRSNRSGSNVSLASLLQNAPQIDRDYEGVGGWLIPRDNDRNSSAIIDNDNDTPAITPSIRPDATPTTFRRRSFGASSSGINSPEMLNTPSLPRYSTSTALSRQSGSPQSYFNNGAAGRSTASISSRRNSKSRRNSRATRTEGSTDERA